MNKINILKLLPTLYFLSICFGGYEFNGCKTKINVDLGDRAKGQLSKQEIEVLRIEAEDICLEALSLEPENAYIALFIGEELYSKELKDNNKAAEMYIEALNRPDGNLGSQHILSVGRKKIYNVHEYIKVQKLADKWYNYGVDANNKAKHDEAIKNFEYSSKLDSSSALRCYGAIAEIYYEHKADVDLALESINTALVNTNDKETITDLKLRKITYLRKSGKKNEAEKILLELLNEDANSIPVQLQLFHLHMDNSDCSSALEMAPDLYIKMEEDPRIPMGNLSELAFNIGVCYNQEGDIKYNLINITLYTIK